MPGIGPDLQTCINIKYNPGNQVRAWHSATWKATESQKPLQIARGLSTVEQGGVLMNPVD